MQLKIRRSQREAGVLSKNVIFCLDARAEFSAAEHHNLSRYKLWKEVIYSSDAAQRYAARGDAQDKKSIAGNFKAIANYAMARLQLWVTVESLGNGQHIECKSLDELLEAEDAIMTACQNLKAYLETAATFDGREVVIDFTDDGPTTVAHAAVPEPALVGDLPDALIAAPAGALPAPLAEFAALPTEAYESPGAYQAGRTFRSYFDPGPEGDRQMKTVLVVAAIIGFLLLIAVAS